MVSEAESVERFCKDWISQPIDYTMKWDLERLWLEYSRPPGSPWPGSRLGSPW
jgi:hypothetical protein